MNDITKKMKMTALNVNQIQQNSLHLKCYSMENLMSLVTSTVQTSEFQFLSPNLFIHPEHLREIKKKKKRIKMGAIK